jgi:hypothetical protein
MADLVRGAFCPTCSRLLYTVSRDEGATQWVQSGARLREDKDGHFVTCPHCRRRVGLRQSLALPGWGFEVDR